MKIVQNGIVSTSIILAFVLASMSIVPTVYAEGFQWRHFGAAPFSHSRTIAMQKRSQAFLVLGIPKEAIQLLMKATESPGIPTTLTVGKKLSAMISRGYVVHRNVTVAFDSPVPNMQYAAPAQMWSVTWKGIVYTVYLPAICHNWSVVASHTKCVSVTFTLHVNNPQVRFAVFTKGERLPSSCWSLTDGKVVSAAPSPCTVCNWVGPLSVLPHGFMVKYSGLYRAHSRVQTLRFPREVTKGYIALCITRDGLGESYTFIIPPHVWKGTSTVDVPYGGISWPVWSRDNIRKSWMYN